MILALPHGKPISQMARTGFAERDARGYFDSSLAHEMATGAAEDLVYTCVIKAHGCRKNFLLCSFAETDHSVIFSAISDTSWIFMDGPEYWQLQEGQLQHQSSPNT